MKRLVLLVLLLLVPAAAQAQQPPGDVYFALFVGNVQVREIRGVIVRPLTKSNDFPQDAIAVGVITGTKMEVTDLPPAATDADVWRAILASVQKLNPVKAAAPKMPTATSSPADMFRFLTGGVTTGLTLGADGVVRHTPARPVEQQPPQTYTDSGVPVSSYRSPAYQQSYQPQYVPPVQRSGYVWPLQTSFVRYQPLAGRVSMAAYNPAFCASGT
jgi:hypothetical protein